MTTYYNKTQRTKVRRRAGRGNYKRATIHSILDEGMVGHIGVVGDVFEIEAEPFRFPLRNPLSHAEPVSCAVRPL